jgi:hypothetical protein
MGLMHPGGGGGGSCCGGSGGHWEVAIDRELGQSSWRHGQRCWWPLVSRFGYTVSRLLLVLRRLLLLLLWGMSVAGCCMVVRACMMSVTMVGMVAVAGALYMGALKYC